MKRDGLAFPARDGATGVWSEPKTMPPEATLDVPAQVAADAHPGRHGGRPSFAVHALFLVGADEVRKGRQKILEQGGSVGLGGVHDAPRPDCSAGGADDVVFAVPLHRIHLGAGEEPDLRFPQGRLEDAPYPLGRVPGRRLPAIRRRPARWPPRCAGALPPERGGPSRSGPGGCPGPATLRASCWPGYRTKNTHPLRA